MGSCELCFDTGFAIVPHCDFVDGGEWKNSRMVGEFKSGWSSRPTMAVNCSCFKGRAITDAQASMEAQRRGLTLERYEERIGREYWQSLMRDDERERMELVRETSKKKGAKKAPEENCPF